ncbi:hypothetical protein ABPG75_009111 [Micractinium tetrahymenae]
MAAFDGQHSHARPAQPPSCTGTPLRCDQAPGVADSAATAGTSATAVSQWAERAPPLAARLQLSQAGAGLRRNLLCASVDWERGEAVLGSADHAAYAVRLRPPTRGRTLYTRAAGHKDWVTAAAHLPDGRVATGGQDAAIWLWPAACEGRRGATASVAAAGAGPLQLAGHAAPVSQLEAVPGAAAPALVSASYDKRLLVWHCGSSTSIGAGGSRGGGRAGTAHQQLALAGHRAPVLQLHVAPGGLAASGDRDGALLRWDLTAGSALGPPLPAHKGHCTALEWWDAGHGCSSSSSNSCGPLLLSGGQDGCVRLWDWRQAAALAQAAAHAGPVGSGAVGSLAAGLPGGAAHLVASAGADCMLRGLDSRRGLATAWSSQLPNFPYSMTMAGTLLLLGCGDGSVTAVDAASGERRWVLAVAGSAVRTLHADPGGGQLVAGCDDGSVAVYEAPRL